jgi:2-methylisocitrate lyase-like PEP mutase family enzyme
MARLKQQLLDGDLVLAPGIFDGLSALVANAMGFGALYLSGYATSASLLGKPDAGYLTATHMTDRVRAICAVADTPIIADADTGFGGIINVEDIVCAYEAAGASAIQLEDQRFPKRCGHTKNREVIDLHEATSKMQMAAESRKDDDFLIIARTDARTSLGLDEALHRCDAYRDAGADILFLESPESEEELEIIGKAFPDTWLLANMVDGGSTPLTPPDRLKDLGFSLAIYPLIGLGAAAAALQGAYQDLQDGSARTDRLSFDDLNKTIGFDRIWALDERFK